MPRTAKKTAEPAPKPKPAGLSKPVTPSAVLAEIVGAEPLPRSAVTARVWEHIKANGLQNPADKRTIVADDKLRAVFGRDRATMFEMPGLLAKHMAA